MNEEPLVAANADQAVTGSPLEAPTPRRVFLRQASMLSLAIPSVGAALTACSPEERAGGAGGSASARAAGQGATSGARTRNPDSKLDTALQHPHAPTSAGAAGAAAAGPYARFDPQLPAAPTNGKLEIHFHAREAQLRISDDTTVSAWTFDGNVPGPIVHCRVGDTVEFTLTNDVDIPHSMDFHAAQIDPKTAFRSAIKGQSISYTFKPKYAGAFLYHCGTSPVLMHLGSGMFGAIVVSPREALPPAKEFVLVQSEHYFAAAGTDGARAYDYQKMLSTLPDMVTFNGRPDQYSREPITVKVGDRVRFWVANAGPTHPCAFHVVGEQFETVYLGAPPGSAIHGVQTFSVPAGGGMVFELMCDVPGQFPFVNHAFGHGQKGAIGYLVVEG